VGEDPSSVRIEVPAIPLDGGEEVHPIGAGDAYTAGFAHVWCFGGGFAEALRAGAATARASCLDPLPSRFSRVDYEQSLARFDGSR